MLTKLCDVTNDYVVSTVLLKTKFDDYPYETKVFPIFDGEPYYHAYVVWWTYKTESEARNGHKEVIEKLNNGFFDLKLEV